MFNLGATLTLKDNYTATMRRVTKEQDKFKREVIKARQEIEKTARKEYLIRLSTSQADRKLKTFIKALEPLRKELVQKVALKEAKQNQINEMKNRLNSIHNKVFSPVIKARDNISSFLNNVKSQILSIQTLAGAIVFGAAGKGAYDLTLGQTAGVEQNAISLQTMLGKKGGKDAMSWGFNTAAKTPFNANQVVDGVKRLTTYQLDYKKYLEPMGDLASSMGKPLEQAIDMLGTMASGDKGEAVMRARELGIGKKDWQSVGINFNKQGSMMVDDPQQAIDGLMQIMKNKNLNGMMKAQSGTANGVMSNIGDNVQGMGRKVAGIKNTGEIVPNGMFDTFKKTLVDVQKTLTMFGNSPAFASFIANVNQMTQVAGTKLKGFFTYLQNNPKAIDKAFNDMGKAFNFVGQMALAIGKVVQVLIPIVEPFLKMLIDHPKLIIGSFIGMKVIFGIFSGFLGVASILNDTKLAIGTFKSAFNFVKEAGLFVKFGNMIMIPLKFIGTSIFGLGVKFVRFGSMALGAIRMVAVFLMANPIILGITLLIGAVILLYNAWKHNWGGIREKTASVVGAVKGFVQGMITKFNNAKDGMSDMAKTVIGAWGRIAKALLHPITAKINMVQNVTKFVAEKVTGGSKKKTTTSKKKKDDGSHAFGLNRVPYNGYRAVLHEGEKVLTKQEARRLDNKNTSQGIIINVNGMTIREEADIKRVAKEFVRQLKQQNITFAGGY